MQIFSSLHTRSSSRNSVRGFTLIELLISASIIGIVSTIVLVKYSNFDSTILLKGAAYEVALTLREAQVKSVSVSGESGQFNFPYGVTFSPLSKTYTVFRFNDPFASPQYDVFDAVLPNYAMGVGSITLTRTMQISDICFTTSSGDTCSANGLKRLDVSFRRPEFKSLFYAINTSDIAYPTSTMTGIKIKLNSTSNNPAVFYVEVSSLGQISIKKE